MRACIAALSLSWAGRGVASCARGSRRVGVPQCTRVHEACVWLRLENIRVGLCVFGGLSEQQLHYCYPSFLAALL